MDKLNDIMLVDWLIITEPAGVAIKELVFPGFASYLYQ